MKLGLGEGAGNGACRGLFFGMGTNQFSDRVDAFVAKSDPETRQQILNQLNELDRLERVEKCREDFLVFAKAMWPIFIESAHHRQMARIFEGVVAGTKKRAIINMRPRVGKALALWTPIPTPSGWTTMGKIGVGDEVFSEDGTVCRVIAKSAVFRDRPVCTVRADDGEQIIADIAHDWKVRMHRSHPGLRVRSTGWLARSERREPRGRMIRQHPGLMIGKTSLPIDPYVLGVWLGDGSSQHATITQGDADLPFIRAEIERRGYKTSNRTRQKDRADTFGVLGLQAQLRTSGLIGGKRIPDKYLRASPQQRLDLLRGLVDTDGYVNGRGQIEITTVKPELALQIQELVWSLGAKCFVSVGRAMLNGEDYGPKYRINFFLARAALLPRKAKNCRDAIKRDRYIQVSLAGVADTACIQVDHPSGMFLCGRSMLPTHNSELTSWLLPAWYIGKYPHKKILQITHTASLATKYGRKVRDLIRTPAYQEIFPGVTLKKDTKAAGKWETTHGGEFYAAGTDTNISGYGADLCVVDDPVSEQDAKTGKKEVFDRVYDWYTSGPRQRLQPDAAVLLLMTRWHKADLTGRLIQASVESPGADQWELVSFPAILPSGATLFPELWPKEQVRAAKASMSVGQWNAQFQQNPTAEEGALIKREWWQRWEKDDEPKVVSTIMSWDTAFNDKQRANYSAMTLWGIFYTGPEEKPKANLVLLDAWRDRVDFPSLKQEAVRQWKKRNPDVFLVENKATGAPLIYELRAMGIPVSEFTPTHSTGDKIVRCNSVTDIFRSGLVWAPAKPNGGWLRWADEVIEECAEFPLGDHDDYLDTVVQALIRFRKGGYIRVPSDFEEPEEAQTKLRRKYYW